MAGTGEHGGGDSEEQNGTAVVTLERCGGDIGAGRDAVGSAVLGDGIGQRRGGEGGSCGGHGDHDTELRNVPQLIAELFCRCPPGQETRGVVGRLGARSRQCSAWERRRARDTETGTDVSVGGSFWHRRFSHARWARRHGACARCPRRWVRCPGRGVPGCHTDVRDPVNYLHSLPTSPAAMGREGTPPDRTVRSVRTSIVRAERGERQKRSRVPDPTSPETDLNPPCWRRDQFRDLSDIFQTREVVGQFLKLTSTELRALLACSTTGVPRRAGLHHPRAAARRRALVHGRLT